VIGIRGRGRAGDRVRRGESRGGPRRDGSIQLRFDTIRSDQLSQMLGSFLGCFEN